MRDLRRSLRWTNGLGFALSFFFGMWLVVFLLSLLKGGIAGTRFPLPAAFVVVGALSLVATVVLLGVVLFRFAWQGADLSGRGPRLLLFAWTCAGAVFFLSQALALLRYGSSDFPHVPSWFSGLYWYLVVGGAAVFALLLWVNSDTTHHPELHEDHDDLDAHEHDEGEAEHPQGAL